MLTDNLLSRAQSGVARLEKELVARTEAVSELIVLHFKAPALVSLFFLPGKGCQESPIVRYYFYLFICFTKISLW